MMQIAFHTVKIIAAIFALSIFTSPILFYGWNWTMPSVFHVANIDWLTSIIWVTVFNFYKFFNYKTLTLPDLSVSDMAEPQPSEE